ncbi:hypothetical protein ZPAH1_orf00142 [Aeromonas phage ZPAH1]|nr:hypothetical protein ASwh1_93 [Aeromonas phage Aswh_1]QQG33904.1 hypothetical protein ZPAH1_orf00142 [Aeromonas phage ZPAH1]
MGKFVFFAIALCFFISASHDKLEKQRFESNMYDYVEGNLNRPTARIGHDMKIVVDQPTPN